MSKAMVRVVARIVAIPEKVEQLKLVLFGLIDPSRQESGCIQYELLQNHEDPTDFVFVEEWESEALLNAHLESPHINEADAKLEGLLAAEPDIRLYRLLA
jgi:quinol monooxygenase YgiN